MAKKKISMTIDEEIFNGFKNYCKKNGMKISTKVELLMRETVKNTSLKEFMEEKTNRAFDSFLYNNIF
jgi:antitoxin component of RelBE/YafQ-DinJ toxin-antitoxin module